MAVSGGAKDDKACKAVGLAERFLAHNGGTGAAGHCAHPKKKYGKNSARPRRLVASRD